MNLSHLNVTDLLCWYAVFLFSVVAHEAGHAFAAWRLGDSTAHDGGQVTLNPLPHILREPTGTVVVPLLSFVMQGWMIGWAVTPIDRMWAYTHPKKSALVALAGPLVNLVIMLLSLAILRWGLSGGWLHHTVGAVRGFQSIVAGNTPFLETVAKLLGVSFCLNTILFLFNLVPFPPLDGATVIKFFIPGSLLPLYDRYLSRPGSGFLGLIAAWLLFPRILGPVIRTLFSLAG
jgi:Zn-dependent protease